MIFGEGFLVVLANLAFALIDLTILEIIFSLFLQVDRAGNVKLTVTKHFGLSKCKKTELFVFGFIILGLTYFFLTNYFQETIVSMLIGFFGYWLILLILAILSFTIFYISFFMVGRKIKFRLCLPFLIISLVLFFILLIGMAIQKGG